MTAPSTEHRLVQALLRAAHSALEARVAPGATPALREEADSALRLAFVSLWGRLSHLELSVTPSGLQLDGVDVLTGDEDSAGLIRALSDAGIRTLTVVPGAELEEIALVLSAVATPGNLLTSLFRADLHYVQYSLDDDPSETGWGGVATPVPETSPDAVRHAVRSEAAAPAVDSGIVRPEKFDSTLYFLDEREIEYLKSAVDREYAQDLALNALDVLLDILELRADADAREEVIGVLEDLLTELLAAGRFTAVAHLVAGVRVAARDARGLSATHKSRLDRIRASISRPGALAQLFHALDGGAVYPTERSLGMLLRELRPEAIRRLLAWSDRLSDAATRTAVVDALDAFFTEWPHGLARMVTAPERDVVQAGLQLAARLKHPEFVDIVSELGTHEDVAVRRAVAEALASIGSASALRRLTRLAEDPDRDVRVVVYRTFSARPFRPAFATLQRAIASADLESLGRREKRALFEAFGRLAGAEGVAVLEPLLRGRNPSGPRPSSHTRACAATALGLIGTPPARSALSQVAHDKDALVRNAVGAALRGDQS